jgi:hypothetical protein
MDSKLKKLLELLQAPDRDDYVTKDVEDVYNTVAKETGRTPEEIAKIGGVESQHGKYLKNMTGSSATGIFQLMPNIIKRLKVKGSPDAMATQEEAMTKLTNEHQDKMGRDNLSVEDLYLLHNQGLPVGKRLIAAPDETPVENILSSKIIESNPRLYKDKTVGGAKSEISRMLEERGKDFKFRPKLEDLFVEEPEEEFDILKRK